MHTCFSSRTGTRLPLGTFAETRPPRPAFSLPAAVGGFLRKTGRVSRPAPLSALLGSLAVLALAVPCPAQTPLGCNAIHSFGPFTGSTSNADGAASSSALTSGSDGSLYGMSEYGGTGGVGTLFKVHPDGSAFQVLHAFSAPDSGGHNTDGVHPEGAVLVGGDGFLYGATRNGGAGGEGTLFKVRPDGGGFQIIHSFGPAGASGLNGDGYPSSGLTDGGDGFFYGVAYGSGTGVGGVVFQVNSDGSVFHTLYFFASATDGSRLNGALAAPGDGFLYGTANQGGTNDNGTLFRLRTDGTSFLVLHTFSGQYGGSSNADGASPEIGLTPGPGGTLFGTAHDGGANGSGTVFKLQPDGTGFQVVHSFGPTAYALPESNLEGANPQSTPVFGSDGLLYGTTYHGGANGIGTVYRVAPIYTHLLWTNTSGAAAIWTVAGDGSFTSTPAFGPIPGWTARTIADGTDGRTRLLWTRTDGANAVWTVNTSDGSFTSTPGYGPYDGGNWNVAALAVGPDNLARLQWKHSPDGQSSVWTVAGDGSFTSTPGFGPYAGTSGPWTAGALAVGGEGFSRLLWGDGAGRFSLWTLDALSHIASTPALGPIPGWTAGALAGGPDADPNGILPSSNAIVRLLLNRSDGGMAVWTVNAASAVTSTPLYGPIPGWNCHGLIVGSDALSRVLWSRTDGMSAVWTIAADGSIGSTPGYGPYSGWSAVALSVAP